MAEERFRMEVKVPDGRGGFTTKVIRLDYADLDNVPLIFGNRFEFPSIGTIRKIYVAEDENRMYRFDEASMTYRIIGSD